MAISSQERLTAGFTALSELAATLTFVAGATVLLGWALDIQILQSLLPGLVTMKVNTALCFLFLGAALWLLQIKRVNPVARKVAQACTFGVMAIAFVTLFEYASGVNVGIDQLLFQDRPDAIFTTHPGRMAVNSTLCFIFSGMALLLLDVKTSRGYYPAQFLAMMIWIISVLSLIGYLYNVRHLYFSVKEYTPMALNAALAFFTVSIGIFFARPDGGIAGVIASASTGGMIARRLFPVTLLIPPTLGWLKLWGERTELISNTLGVSLVATANMAIISSCVMWLIIFMNRIDAERVGREEELRANDQQLRAINQQLRANEQQLQASNQQLRATQQQLEASNQQMRASQEQLRAGNEQLRANEQMLRAKIEHRTRMEEEAQKHLHELQIFFKSSTDREERILQLKEKIRGLEEELKKK